MYLCAARTTTLRQADYAFTAFTAFAWIADDRACASAPQRVHHDVDAGGLVPLAVLGERVHAGRPELPHHDQEPAARGEMRRAQGEERSAWERERILEAFSDLGNAISSARGEARGGARGNVRHLGYFLIWGILFPQTYLRDFKNQRRRGSERLHPAGHCG